MGNQENRSVMISSPSCKACPSKEAEFLCLCPHFSCVSHFELKTACIVGRMNAAKYQKAVEYHILNN